MTTSHKYGCEHPGCHEVGGISTLCCWSSLLGYHYRYMCAAHADKEATNDG